MKRNIKLLMAVCLLLVSGLEGFAQNLSNKGREFWVGYGHHQFMEPGQSNSQEMVLYFSAEQTANVTVTVRGRTASQVTNYVVPAGTVIASSYMPKAGALDCRLYDVPPTFGGNGGEGTFVMSVHIESDVPIVAYAHTFGSASSGATMLMPVETWGHKYISINSKQRYANNCFSWAYAIAYEDNTVIQITPSVLTRLNKPAGVPFNVTLNKGEVYQIIGANPSNGADALEVSGTKFESIANPLGACYPIAVFSGSSRTSNPISCGSGGGDNDNQQLFPTQAWGKRYLTSPTSRSTGANLFMTNSYKVLVKDPTTVVKRNGITLTGIQQNSFYFFESNTADVIEADKPVMVAQFMTGGACMGGGVGDPEMIYISPDAQGIKRIGFYRNTRENITVNYLTLIIPTNGVASLRIDGSPAFDHSYPHPQLSGYTVIVKRWTSAQAQSIVNSDSAFTAITYGLGSVESYGYNAGTLINNLSLLGSIHNINDTTIVEHRYTCTRTPFSMSALLAYKPTQIIWQLSQRAAVLVPNADVIENSPSAVDSLLVNGVQYYKYTLPGTYQFLDTGTFRVPILSTHPSIENCYNRENLYFDIIVKGKPEADFTISHTGCTLDPINFQGRDTTGNNYIIRDFNWTFPGPITATGQTQIQTLPPGTYNINLGVVSTEGCTSDTTKQITIYDKPPGNFSVTPAGLCEGQSFVLNDTSSAAIAVNEWYWDFGNGVTQTVNSGPTVTYTYPTFGTYTIRHVARSSVSCVSDTISRIVTVYAKPTVSFTNNAAGCLAPSGLVQFSGTASSSDAQAITSYAWNFGDPNATVPNPNTATVQNPSHNYQQGTYNISFSATTANGCTKDSVQTITFNLKPALTYPALNAICENAAPVSIATANVINAVTGTGTYIGPGTSTTGIFDPATAGFGTHTIWYKFTTTANCIDSVSQAITVHARPRTTFTIPASGCLPANGQVMFTNTSTIPDAQTMSWLWNFNDPNANAGNPNSSVVQHPTHNYLEGTYTINLQTTSSNGCVKDSSITTTFSVTPLLSYNALAAICENAAPVSLANATVTNGVVGTGVYSGPGIDATGMFNPTTSGYGSHNITYSFTSTGGCVQTVSQPILVHARPRTSFALPAAGCLSTTGQVQFTNTSTIPDGQSLSWLWNFNDPNANAGNPNSSTILNPTHNYQQGTYTINLQATSANGCVKDTSITSAFSLTPALTFPALTNVCQNPGAAPSSIAFASATNGVTGTGVYSGPGTNAAGLFDPNVAGPGIHTITYTLTSSGGCAASVSNTIEVYARPDASFTVGGANSICLGQTVTLTNTSTISSGTINTWNWDLGNGTTPSYANGNPFTVNYTIANNYTVRLVTVSDRGCFSLPVTQQIAVRPLPVSDYVIPTGICMPGGIANFSNASSVSDNSALSYAWDFGDGGSSGNTNPAHTYAGINSYPVTLVVTSAFGCTNTITKTLNASSFVDKPVADFSVSPQELCQGQSNLFSDNSSAPNNTLQTWNWNFGDGGTSNTASPTKTFNTPGTYTTTLTVINAAGCVSTPATRVVTVHLQPVIDAGPSYVLSQGTLVMVNATANSTTGVNFSWSPAIGLSNATILNPELTALVDQTYTLTAIGNFGCTSTDLMTVKILKPIKVPNVFSPNGDNIHDQWVIPNMSDYPGGTVEIFNRYGQQVFYSANYTNPWNGTYNGKELPAGTYYYVIQLQNGFKPLTGSVTIIR